MQMENLNIFSFTLLKDETAFSQIPVHSEIHSSDIEEKCIKGKIVINPVKHYHTNHTIRL